MVQSAGPDFLSHGTIKHDAIKHDAMTIRVVAENSGMIDIALNRDR